MYSQFPLDTPPPPPPDLGPRQYLSGDISALNKLNERTDRAEPVWPSGKALGW